MNWNSGKWKVLLSPSPRCFGAGTRLPGFTVQLRSPQCLVCDARLNVLLAARTLQADHIAIGGWSCSSMNRVAPPCMPRSSNPACMHSPSTSASALPQLMVFNIRLRTPSLRAMRTLALPLLGSCTCGRTRCESPLQHPVGEPGSSTSKNIRVSKK